MSKQLIVLLLLFSFIFLTQIFITAVNQNEGVIILCYHDVSAVNDPWTVSYARLKEQFDYLKNNNYTPISLEDYLNASQNPWDFHLPPKPVLIMIDDGYLSAYTKVFPLLKEYNYPATFSIVTSWLEKAPEDVPPLLNWPLLKEMEASNLAAIVSHSHDLHNFIGSNPQGSVSQAPDTFKYDHGCYEVLEDYCARIRQDLYQSQAAFLKNLGHKAKGIVWPYGSYTKFAVDIAFEAGYEACFGLGEGFNYPGVKSLKEASRIMITNNHTIERFAELLKSGGKYFEPINAAQLDIDLIYDADSFETIQKNLELAINNFRHRKINTVFLQAFCDNDGSGDIKSVYFYTTAAPVKADIFNYIATRLRNEGFKVYAWMPTLACQWIVDSEPDNMVTAYDAKGKGWYRRASPFNTGTKDKLALLFADLAAYNYIDGILFQDDLYLTDYEDFSPHAKAAFAKATNLKLSPPILKKGAIRDQWTKLKTRTLTDLTVDLTEVVREYRPLIRTARNIYSIVILDPKSEEWMAQNYRQYLKVYDYTVIEAYPYMEGAGKDPEAWLGRLALKALAAKDSGEKVIFKIQTYDWENKRWLSVPELIEHYNALKKSGAINVAHYPENVFSE